jgi:hypothetical protein
MMAHFAKIDEEGNVLDVLPIDNSALNGKDYPNADEIGSVFLNSCGFRGKWIQTSYNNNFRKNCAVVGGKYDKEKDAFYDPESPHKDCVWDEENMRWRAP